MGDLLRFSLVVIGHFPCEMTLLLQEYEINVRIRILGMRHAYVGLD